MSDLSLFIYAAYVIPNVATLIGALSFFSLLGALILKLVAVADTYDDIKGPRNWHFFAIISVILLTCIVPNQQTMYLMAGATIAENATDTEEFRKVRAILNEQLDAMLEEEDDD